MRLDLNFIRQIADMIADTDENRENETGFLDTLEGECEAMEIADYLIATALDDEATVEAIKQQENMLNIRRKRIEHRANQKRKAQVDLLKAMGVKKLERPRATISLRSGLERADITDPEAIPSQLCTIKEVRTPDKAAIKSALQAGEEIPGAALIRGEDGITVRMN